MAPYYLVYGLDPVDNGDVYDPWSRGTPVYENLDVSSATSQVSLSLNLSISLSTGPDLGH